MKVIYSFKKSGEYWIDEYPSHWDMVKFKYLFDERNEKNHPEEKLLSATQTRGVIQKDDFNTRTVTALKDLHLQKLVEVDDFVISLRSFQGGIERAYSRGIISPAYTVLTPSNVINTDYFMYVAKSIVFIDLLKTCVTGIRDGQNINYSLLGRIKVPLPNLIEQKQIARYLDYKNSLINKYIRIKRKQIELLEELKQTIINDAVTGKIDVRTGKPYSKYKDSGIEWLGMIPEEWDCVRLKYIAEITTGYAFSSNDYITEGVPLMRIGSFDKDGSVSVEKSVKLPFDHLHNYKEYRVVNGDILLAMTGATIGKVGRYESDNDGLLNQRVCLYRSKTNTTNQEYLFFLLKSEIYYRQIMIACYGGAQENISDVKLKNFVVPLPCLSLQISIMRYVQDKLISVETKIAQHFKEILLLQELQTRLIADVVTGKFDAFGEEIIDDNYKEGGNNEA